MTRTRRPTTQHPTVLIAGTGLAVGITVDGKSQPVGDGRYPPFRWGLAPVGVMTRRQLRAAGLRPGGAEPVARLVWRRGERWAELYAVNLAKPKRPMTQAKQRALDAAMTARRTCPLCARDAGYVLPTHLGCCLDCAETTRQETAA
jgi:hypothetical protein